MIIIVLPRHIVVFLRFPSSFSTNLGVLTKLPSNCLYTIDHTKNPARPTKREKKKKSKKKLKNTLENQDPYYFSKDPREKKIQKLEKDPLYIYIEIL